MHPVAIVCMFPFLLPVKLHTATLNRLDSHCNHNYYKEWGSLCSPTPCLRIESVHFSTVVSTGWPVTGEGRDRFNIKGLSSLDGGHAGQGEVDLAPIKSSLINNSTAVQCKGLTDYVNSTRS